MILFENGAKISSIVVSTIFGHYGNGMFPYFFHPNYLYLLFKAKKNQTTIITKSSTRNKMEGNYVWWNFKTWECVQKISGQGLLNAYKLTNDGIYENAKKIASSQNQGYNVIPSFFPELDKMPLRIESDIIEAMDICRNAMKEKFKIMELNYSCANKSEILDNMKQAIFCAKRIKTYYPWLKIIAKISVLHPYKFAMELERAGIDVLHAVNAVPYRLVYSNKNKRSPLHHLGGGAVSGKPILEMALRYNSELRKKVGLPMIMGGGIMSLADINRYSDIMDIRHNSISICTLVRYNPKLAAEILEKFNKI